jgi:F-type H+-transporting ATPase subunit b
MEIISNTALISINETFFAQLGSFLIFLFIMNRLMIQPLRGVINERNNYIDTLRRDVISAEMDMEDIHEQLKKKEADVRSEALALKEQAEALGAQKADEIFAAVNKEIAAMKAKSEKEVNAQLDNARKHLKKEAETLAISIMEKILGRGVSK